LLSVPADATEEQIKQMVMNAPEAQKWLQGKEPKKWIIVKNKIINVVL
jgi:leucyl-tRNA synthetase